MELEKKLSHHNRNPSSDQIQQTKIYRHKVSETAGEDVVPKPEDYELVPSAIVPGTLAAVERSTKSFYHFTRARSAKECLDHCIEMKVTGHHEQCNLAVAKPMIGEDRQTGRKQIEYECSFYDYSLDFTGEHKPKIPPMESYQLIRDGRNTQFDRVDPDSEPVRYAMETYEPVHVVQNVSSRDKCLTECLHFKANNKLNILAKALDCQMVTVLPRIMKNELVLDVSIDFWVLGS